MEDAHAVVAAIKRAIFLDDLHGVMAFVEEDSQVMNMVDRRGHTALHFACEIGHVGIAAYLLDHGANINQQSTSTLSTPLSLACWSGQPSVVQLVLDRGADPTITDEHGNIPLMAAALFGWTEVVRCLLGHETAAATIDYVASGWTALAWLT